MSKLSDKAKKALDETRMLILGAQVFIGFDFQAAFQPGFERLPTESKRLETCGLALMRAAAGLFLAPGAYHQIAEEGNDAPRLIAFTGRIASVGLLPFALGIGVVDVRRGPDAHWARGSGCGSDRHRGRPFAVVRPRLDMARTRRATRNRAKGTAQKEQRMAEPTPLEKKIEQVLTEARVVLPGAQALLGFQFSAMLIDAFGTLSKTSQYIHLTSLMLIAASIVR